MLAPGDSRACNLSQPASSRRLPGVVLLGQVSGALGKGPADLAHASRAAYRLMRQRRRTASKVQVDAESLFAWLDLRAAP